MQEVLPVEAPVFYKLPLRAEPRQRAERGQDGKRGYGGPAREGLPTRAGAHTCGRFKKTARTAAQDQPRRTGRPEGVDARANQEDGGRGLVFLFVYFLSDYPDYGPFTIRNRIKSSFAYLTFRDNMGTVAGDFKKIHRSFFSAFVFLHFLFPLPPS